MRSVDPRGEASVASPANEPMGVHVRDLKDNGKAWIVVHDRRVPKRYLRKYVGSDWKAAKRAASIIRERLAANDLTFLHLHGDRKSTRLNSSHQIISYAVFCLKKKTT